jgi:glycosyltransferase involved in cell wall biosynthesis
MSARLRVAIATDWFAPRRGGIESQLEALAQGLAARGHAVDVITTTPDARDGANYRVRVLDVARIPVVGVALTPELPTALRDALRVGYDVVHAHASVVSPLAYTAATVARGMTLPVVVTFHSVLLAKRALLAAAGSLARLHDSPILWTAVSSLVARQAASALGTEVVTLPNGIDLDFWQLRKGNLPHQRCRFVTAIRLHRKKRPAALITAFATAVRRAGAGLELVVIGDGPERSSAERLVGELGIPDQVRFTGWLSADGVRDEYAGADAFVLPSTREAFGIAALEARCAGLPVVAMAGTGTAEFLVDGENALLARDDAALAQAIVRLATDDALRRRLAASAGSMERFGWPAILTRHEELYRDAITRAGEPTRTVAL